MDEELTRVEQLAIELLKKVARHWPKSLWLFAADSELHIMKKANGERVMNGEAFDQAFIVESINIETDGGDW